MTENLNQQKIKKVFMFDLEIQIDHPVSFQNSDCFCRELSGSEEINNECS